MLLLLGVTIGLSACQKGGGSGGSSPSDGPAQAAPNQPGAPVAHNGGGGIDGSGGDSVHSSLEQVKKAFSEEAAALQKRLSYMTMKYSQADELVYDFQFGRGSRKLVGDFLLMSQPDQNTSPLSEGLRSQTIQIKPQLEACQSKDGLRSGSAKGNYKNGEICISYQELQKISPFSLNLEIFSVLIHELSHLSGFDEAKAVQIQYLVYQKRLIYSTYDEVGFINGLISCDRNLITKEAKEMEDSVYWQEQKRKLVELLSGEQPRGCGPGTNKMTDRVDIFEDDAEFLSITSKFPSSGYRWASNRNSGGEAGAYIGYGRIQDISVVASIHVQTPTAWIWIDAQMGKDGQCSPKILMANLIANIPDILEMGCNTKSGIANDFNRVRARILKEKEILEGEKKK
jgi:hypothetical protein